ncbi:MAG: CARDB domain-containing protein [Candidatus Saccharicenans sp.]|uniref:CARDB domain-containing protein n=1 Tax=Candidatus Saccharicenans sp. TaxID=2819258 RepID=UPI0040498DB2
MKRINSRFKKIILTAAFCMLVFLPLLPQVPVQKKILPPRTAALTDPPQIKEFKITPAAVVKGNNVVIHRRVEPGRGGTTINRLAISKLDGFGPAVNLVSSDLSGEFNLSIPATSLEGITIYGLTAVNELYQTSMAMAPVRITGPADLIVEEIQSQGQSVAFSLKNNGSGDFRGRLIFRVTINGNPGSIRLDHSGLTKIADGVYEARDMAIASGNSWSFGLLDPETGQPGWYTGTYTISVRLESDNPAEPAANNEKRVTLNHTGLHRGRPELDLYLLGDLTVLNYEALAHANQQGIRFTVMNTGPATATNIEWEARIFEREHLLRGESGWRLKSGTISSLAPGSTEVTFDFLKPDLAGRGLLLKVIIDPKDKIFESDETNNQKEIAIRIPDRMF